jgi:hypothetical protein
VQTGGSRGQTDQCKNEAGKTHELGEKTRGRPIRGLNLKG